VLFDYVISYTAIDNPWFVASCEQTPSRTSNWFIWTDNIWKSEFGKAGFMATPSQRQFPEQLFLVRAGIELRIRPARSEEAVAAADQPSRCPGPAAEMKKVMRFWLDLGADGFRADMASAWSRASAIIVPQTNTGMKSARSAHGLSAGVHRRRMVRPKGALDDAFQCVFHPLDPKLQRSLPERELAQWERPVRRHSFFDREGKGDVARFLRITRTVRATRAKGYVTIPLGNHDIARINNHRTVDELEMIMAFGLTMPGVPFIYYGNEIGMRQLGDNLPRSKAASSRAPAPARRCSGRRAGTSVFPPPIHRISTCPSIRRPTRPMWPPKRVMPIRY